jgi:hypothetical protein
MIMAMRSPVAFATVLGERIYLLTVILVPRQRGDILQ